MARLNFEIPEEKFKEIDALVERLGLKTKIHLFNAALTLFKWAASERELGRAIASVDRKTGDYKEIEMVEFPSALNSIPYPLRLRRDEAHKIRDQARTSLSPKYRAEVPIGSLTEQEAIILRYLVQGKTVREIANELSVSQRTVETSKKNLFDKLDLSLSTQRGPQTKTY